MKVVAQMYWRWGRGSCLEVPWEGSRSWSMLDQIVTIALLAFVFVKVLYLTTCLRLAVATDVILDVTGEPLPASK